MGEVGVRVVCDEPIVRAALTGLASVGRPAARAFGTVDAALGEGGEGCLVLVGVEMLGCEPRRVLASIGARSGGIIVFGGRHDAAVAHGFVDAGARGYLSRLAEPEEVRAAIVVVLAGGHHLPEGLRELVWARMLQRLPVADRLLTARESEVARLLAEGKTTPQIASALFVSRATAKTHLDRIYAKLAVGCRAAAVAELARLGVLEHEG